jgi:hypothetical protein
MAPLELTILHSLDAGPNHGSGITLDIETVPGGLLGVEWAGTAKVLNRLLRYA